MSLPDEGYAPFLQTDVTAESSSGPLFNLAGEVIGIDSQGRAPTRRSPAPGPSRRGAGRGSRCGR